MLHRVVVAIGIALVIACARDAEQANSTPESGESLAQQFCVTCHSFPEPSLLPKAAWRDHVLPRMACFYGRYSPDLPRTLFVNEEAGGSFVERSGLFPMEPTMDDETWQAIEQYYIENAPSSLNIAKANVSDEPPPFEIVVPSVQISPPSTTMIVPAQNGGFYLADALTKRLIVLDGNFNTQAVANTGEGVVSSYQRNGDIWLTVMGSFTPTDEPSGFLMKLSSNRGSNPELPIRGLQRPVHSSFADLDGNGTEEVIISEFGKWTGSLGIWTSDESGNFNKTTLSHTAGAICTRIHDMNGDGRLDIIALFGQGDERIDIYYNEGALEFREEQLLRFPPSYGSSYFALHDLDDDGDMDIIYTAGDNADFTPVLKPYHGVYGFLNNGGNAFEMSFFHQLNGAYKAIPKDFDQDGDLDIAAISFFPDWKDNANEGFVLLDNTGDFSFQRHQLPIENFGRWMVMESLDAESDGLTDLLLGSLSFEQIPDMGHLNTWVEKRIPFILLRNTANGSENQ